MTFVNPVNLHDCFGSGYGNNSVRMTESRKRSREDDASEFMPLSKRINNLHINNNLGNAPVTRREESNDISELKPDRAPPNMALNSESTPIYDPCLGPNESDYYYNNKLLFELHLARIQRNGQQFPY